MFKLMQGKTFETFVSLWINRFLLNVSWAKLFITAQTWFSPRRILYNMYRMFRVTVWRYDPAWPGQDDVWVINKNFEGVWGRSLHWPRIGQAWSRDLNSGLWLVNPPFPQGCTAMRVCCMWARGSVAHLRIKASLSLPRVLTRDRG